MAMTFTSPGLAGSSRRTLGRTASPCGGEFGPARPARPDTSPCWPAAAQTSPSPSVSRPERMPGALASTCLPVTETVVCYMSLQQFDALKQVAFNRSQECVLVMFCAGVKMFLTKYRNQLCRLLNHLHSDIITLKPENERKRVEELY